MEQDKAKTEINKVLEQQAQKGIKRNEICRSLFSFGFSELQFATVMAINHRYAHAAKLRIRDDKREMKDIENYLVPDVIRLQAFLKNVKHLVGQSFTWEKG